MSTERALWEKISANAQVYVSDTFLFERGRLLLGEAFEAADRYQLLD